ncbi:DUF1302 domain-containing protein [Paracraurococcus lichenis]|uniref:DUF1302 domain-containing protein n=1 Tax=Paracraurococcus lichenis TaxID=3064888 RepID=A0ABT9E6V8_9PROT|nr:DUF1302 domain-containing protein [Paracraurococcus sp. LOR1-02]MDO9711921.1 DUF1302 domain-containing protein [Paracraurococcus sp. LOR1-02]
MGLRRVGGAGALLIMLAAGPAGGAEWEVQEGRIRLDTTLLAASVFRVERPDAGLIGIANGGRVPSLNGDDGDLNYRRRGTVSALLRATSELEVQRDGFGILAAGTLYFDALNASRGATDRTPLSNGALDIIGRGGRLLNAYAYGRFDLADRPIELRAGAIALNWGEAAYIPNGISAIAAYDLPRLVSPNATLREGLLPVPMVNATARLAPGLALEGFVQVASETVLLNPSGSYFSTADTIGAGGRRLFLGYLPPASDLPPYLPGSFVPRGADRGPRDGGQFGFALRWSPGELGSTELGMYYLQLNSRLPVVSFRTGALPAGAALGPPQLAQALYAASSRYFLDYPSDIQLIGLSVSTPLPLDLTLRAEASWRIGQPLQLDPNEMGLAALSPVLPALGTGQLGRYGFGQEVTGYRRQDVGTLIAGLNRTIPAALGADQVQGTLEGGLTAVPDLPGRAALRFAGPGVYTSGDPLFTAIGAQPYTSTKGFASRLSGGYRLILQADYFNAVGPVSLSPYLALAHDLGGVTPAPLATYVRDRKAMTIGVTAGFLSRWAAGVEYTRFFGGGDANLLRDRDYVTALLRTSF